MPDELVYMHTVKCIVRTKQWGHTFQQLLIWQFNNTWVALNLEVSGVLHVLYCIKEVHKHSLEYAYIRRETQVSLCICWLGLCFWALVPESQAQTRNHFYWKYLLVFRLSENLMLDCKSKTSCLVVRGRPIFPPLIDQTELRFRLA